MNDEQYAVITEILGGLYIQSLRMYDLLCIIGDKLGADVTQLSKLHEEGYTLGPDPTLRLDETDEKPSDNRLYKDESRM
jgi:hypothetical protein